MRKREREGKGGGGGGGERDHGTSRPCPRVGQNIFVYIAGPIYFNWETTFIHYF